MVDIFSLVDIWIRPEIFVMMQMTPILGNIDSRDVTVAYDDDVRGIMDSKDVTFAYDDVTMGF